jgi:hypothetical protein
MDLGQYRYVDELNEPAQVAFLLLLLSLLPFLVALVTTILRRPGTTLTDSPTGRLTKIPFVGRFVVARMPRWGLLLLAAIPVWILCDFDQRVLAELLTLPWGTTLALLPIALGTIAGILLVAERRTRPLTIAAVTAAAVSVLAAVAFAGQFDAPVSAGGGDDSRPGSTRPPVELVTPSDRPQPTTSVTPEMPKGTYEPSQVHLPTGTYTTTGICLAGRPGTPVAIVADSPAIVEAILPDGTVEQVGDVSRLRPCDERDGSDPTLLNAPHEAITQLDGSAFPLDVDRPVALISALESEGGEQLTWVWRRIEGVTYSGVVRTDQIRN